MLRWYLTYAKPSDGFVASYNLARQGYCAYFHGCLPPRIGARVEVGAGLFQRIEGIFEREDGAERAVILPTALGYQAQLHMPALHLTTGNAA